MSFGRVARWLLLTIGLSAVVGMVSLVGVVMGATKGSLATAVLLRSVLALAILSIALVWAVGAWRHDRMPFFLTSVGCAYLLQPYAFTGQVLAAQFLSGNPWIRTLIDAAIWMGVAAYVVVRQRQRHPWEPEPVDLGVLR
ncbi:hypothetical protein [Knoellia subterranea]|uniref:Uncharacterized protein n=1 Tax=Knoellia subterranea KCTC 19937 TaxID=1385521 RepID=A0A0A0JRX1_9MICO|nr:hypothetical protein [Knoellia subterranea]KGN38356.1 hypothetical protein N803_11270 [Knoellia subterranea KCTC 19937]